MEQTNQSHDSDRTDTAHHHSEHHHEGHGDHNREHHSGAHTDRKDQSISQLLSPFSMILLGVVMVILLLNQFQVQSISSSLGAPSFFAGASANRNSGNVDLAAIDPTTLKSTAHTVAAVFPVDEIKTSEDALAVMFPTGTPEYGAALGVSFDDPVASLATLSSMYRGLKSEVEKNNPEAFKRFMALASLPVGISCEYCCGVGPIGVDRNGDSACGCQHNPALLSVALYLTAYTDYNEGEILQEVMKWKTLFFPKNMVELGLSVAGSEPSALQDLPGMVGGC